MTEIGRLTQANHARRCIRPATKQGQNRVRLVSGQASSPQGSNQTAPYTLNTVLSQASLVPIATQVGKKKLPQWEKNNKKPGRKGHRYKLWLSARVFRLLISSLSPSSRSSPPAAATSQTLAPPASAMADDHYSSKRKYDDPSPPPRRTGFSSAPPAASPPSGGAPASYNSVPPPPADEIQLAKQRAQAIAARLFNAAEAKRPRLDAGGDDDDAGAGVGSLGSSGGRATGLGFSSSAGGGEFPRAFSLNPC